MSRSYKKHPIVGNTAAASEKEDKVRAHKKFRRLQNIKLKEVEKIDKEVLDEVDDDDILPTHMKEVSEVWTFAKDGKQIVKGKHKEKALRK